MRSLTCSYQVSIIVRIQNNKDPSRKYLCSTVIEISLRSTNLAGELATNRNLILSTIQYCTSIKPDGINEMRETVANDSI